MAVVNLNDFAPARFLPHHLWMIQYHFEKMLIRNIPMEYGDKSLIFISTKNLNSFKISDSCTWLFMRLMYLLT